MTLSTRTGRSTCSIVSSCPGCRVATRRHEQRSYDPDDDVEPGHEEVRAGVGDRRGDDRRRVRVLRDRRDRPQPPGLGREGEGDVRGGEALRRARRQAPEARQPLALHARASTTARTTTRTASARPTASTARPSSSDGTSTSSCRRTPRELGITFFATAFDLPSADFLADLDMPAYKIASGDLTNTPLLRHVAEIGKPMIISTGGATLDDVRRAYETLHADQPAARRPPVHRRLPGRVGGARPAGRSRRTARCFPDAVVGFSSHDNGIAMAVAAYVLGARVVEKHFTLNRAWKGTDHRFSLEPQGLRKMVRDLRRTRARPRRRDEEDVPERGRPDHEDGQEARGRAATLPPATCSRPRTSRCRSPGGGVPPYELDAVLGRTLKYPVDDRRAALVRASAPGNRSAARNPRAPARPAG